MQATPKTIAVTGLLVLVGGFTIALVLVLLGAGTDIKSFTYVGSLIFFVAVVVALLLLVGSALAWVVKVGVRSGQDRSDD